MLEKLKKALKITTTEQDSLLEGVLLQSKMIVEKKLWYSLEKTKYTEFFYSDNQTSLFLLKAPILSIKKISSGTVKSYKKNALYLQKAIRGEIIVEYDWGLETIPQSVELAMINLAKEIYKQETAEGLEIRSKKISSLSISYFTPEEMKKGSTALKETDLNALLAPYKLLHCYTV